ncbi:MAG: diguanylate cyclase [Microthrixaceae bacterium]|nr:diguanylate cyclase [Microthrixaceae bacterium]
MDDGRTRCEKAILNAVLERSPAAVFLSDPDGRVETVNRRWCELTGAPPEAALGDRWMTLVHPGDRAEVVGAWWTAVQYDAVFDRRFRIQRPDGTETAVRGTAERVVDELGRTVGWTGSVQLDADVDPSWTTARTRSDNGRFEQAFDRSPIGMALTTLEGQYVRVNQAMCDLLGRSHSDLLDTSVLDTTHPEDLNRTVDAAVELLDGTTPSFSLEKRFVSVDGLPVWTRATTTLLRGEDGEPRHFLTQVEDIEERRQLMQQLHQAAIHDPLTGLANRAGLEEYIDTLVPGTDIGVIALDLDRFKYVNDSAGHAAGDEVLRVVADRIVSAVRMVDHTARTGGDEFMVVCPDLTSDHDLAAMAGRLVAAICEPIEVGDGQVRVGASVGVAKGPSTDVPELRIRADEASYRAKRDGGAIVAMATGH